MQNRDKYHCLIQNGRKVKYHLAPKYSNSKLQTTKNEENGCKLYGNTLKRKDEKINPIYIPIHY